MHGFKRICYYWVELERLGAPGVGAWARSRPSARLAGRDAGSRRRTLLGL